MLSISKKLKNFEEFCVGSTNCMWNYNNGISKEIVTLSTVRIILLNFGNSNIVPITLNYYTF